ncbi:3'-5' exonuclease [Methanocalculus sp.]|uniref:3'-5' exonuclease n=1 Tax=Methanocalculus sp. TaxID=2004547 RepID=UPI002639A860|nr:3'-5' exonuclease [Methanocalculus sp.]MDG6249200.1 3'-5' exonuclease [Methanocalculus sp.]
MKQELSDIAGNYLFLDTETTGMIRIGQPSPRLVEIAWLICDTEGTILERDEYVIRPDGFTIPRTATSVHGITTDYARRVGGSLQNSIEALSLCAGNCSLIIGHNVKFDLAIIAGECRRIGVLDPLAMLPSVCTMEETAAFCGIRRMNGYKWPTLLELHLKLFGRPYENTHRAANDVMACARCFFALKHIGFWDNV